MTDPFRRPPTVGTPPPSLPLKWHAVVLLTPYRDGEIFAAEIDYDWTVQSMRVRMVGLEGTTSDILYVGEQFFILAPDAATATRKFGPFASLTPVPAPDWLASRAVTHVGAGKIMGVDCDWWFGTTPCTNGYQNPPPKTPALVYNWFWIRRDNGLPFRQFLSNASNSYRLPGLGEFSLSIFTEFAAAKSTDLPDLVAAAQRTTDRLPAPVEAAVRSAMSPADLRTAIAALYQTQAGSAALRPGDLIKGLEPAPPDAPLPEWPDRLCITGFTFPTSQTPGTPPVLPMRVFYDAPAGQMLTRCSLAPYGFSAMPVEDMILDRAITHLLRRYPDGSHQCIGTVPVGLPKQHWAKDGGAKPKAVIRDNPVLGPGLTLHVTTIPSEGDRWFWVWYTPDNTGRLFMETPQFGDVGLVLTDYDSFDHNPPPFPADAFTVPTDCLAPKPQDPPKPKDKET